MRLLRRASFLATLGLALLAAGAVAQNVDPLSTGSKYAYGENVGWLNAQPSGPGGMGAEVHKTLVKGYLWGENIGWVNLNCANNGTCGTTGNYGVVNDGLGNLSGYAWSENTGWINFSCTTINTACGTTGNYQVKINPWTGKFSGKAWGENIGWVSFDWSSGAPAVNEIQTSWACPFDLDQNLAENSGQGKVGFSDLLIFAAAYNSIPSSGNWNPMADFDHSNKVGFGDLLLFAGHYNQTLLACLPA